MTSVKRCLTGLHIDRAEVVQEHERPESLVGLGRNGSTDFEAVTFDGSEGLMHGYPRSLPHAIQNMPFAWVAFFGSPISCNTSQCSMALPSASILKMSTPAIPRSCGSSLNRLRKWTCAQT